MTTPTPAGVSVAWFRRDLRLHDNPALTAALDHGRVLPLYVLNPTLLDGPSAGANRTWFLLESLRVLAAELAARGAPLLVRRGDPAAIVPAVAAAVGARDVYAARDASPFARRRDAAVARRLSAAGTTLHLLRGQFVVEPDALSTDDGRPFTVFTPWFRRWLAVPRRVVLPAPDRIPGVRQPLNSEALPSPGVHVPSADLVLLPHPGEAAARERLDAWARSARPARYGSDRNLLAVDGTSRLSADLKFGLLSPVEVLAATEFAGTATDLAGTAPEGVDPAGGRATFASEVAWRDFYGQVLWHHPHVVRGAFRPAFDRMAWRDDPAGLQAWREGLTGYPVVDAAMRQLAASGWMHNRARMIAASFLTKDLLVSWREGERHFMAHLVDGDTAANNGGWQWTAGTGTDASPFFRVFNPVTQGERFDPDGAYVRRWVPELAGVPAPLVHRPWQMTAQEQERAGCRIGHDYPAPIVDHAFARERALAAFAELREPPR